MISNTVLKKIQLHIGDRIKYLRKANGIKQENLCMEIGISRTTLSDYENGKTLPTLENLIRIADYFQIGCDDLIGTNGILYDDTAVQNDLIDISGLSRRDALLIHTLITTMKSKI